jgi:hypothetical protein
LLVADLGGTGAESSVAGQEFGGDGERGGHAPSVVGP